MIPVMGHNKELETQSDVLFNNDVVLMLWQTIRMKIKGINHFVSEKYSDH